MSQIHTDLSIMPIAVAPSPATTGTTLSVSSTTAGLLPDTYPYWAVLAPTGEVPTRDNAEIVKVTGGTTGEGVVILTIVREQGIPATTAQTVTTSFSIYDANSAEANLLNAQMSISDTDPATPQEGNLYINNVDNYLKVYYSGLWQNVKLLFGYPDSPTIYSVAGSTSSPYTGTDSTPNVVVHDVEDGDLVKIYAGTSLVGSDTATTTSITITTSALSEAEHDLTAVIVRSGVTSDPSDVFAYTYVAGLASTLLVHFDGTNGQTTYTAETGQVFTFSGGSHLITADKKFGASCLLVGLSGNQMTTVPNSSDWNFGSGDFTIDFWVNLVGNDTGYLFSQVQDDNNRFLCYTYGGGNIDCNLIQGGASGVGQITVAGAIPDLGYWHHFALVRYGNRYDMYIDGTSVGHKSDSTTRTGNTGVWSIGNYGAGGGTALNGKIDEFRIVKGTAAWTDYVNGFTPPTSPYTL